MLIMLDPFTMVDMFAWFDRRTLANSIELTCSNFKELIETSCLAKRPYHLIQTAMLYTNYADDGWRDCWDEFKHDLSYSCISDSLLCGYHYHLKQEIKFLEFSLFNPNRHTNWLKLRLGKTKKRHDTQTIYPIDRTLQDALTSIDHLNHLDVFGSKSIKPGQIIYQSTRLDELYPLVYVGGIDQAGVNSFLKRKKCSPSVVPPIYVRFSETYICVDIFDEMLSTDWSASASIGADEIENVGTAGTNNECGNQKTSTNALMACSSKKGQQKIVVNCSKATKWLMALLTVMLPNFEGTKMKFNDNSLGLKAPIVDDILCVEATNPWCYNNDAQALANVFAHPTWSAMIANSERCICQLPTVMPTKQLSIEGTPHQQNGMLLNGILLKCDRFSYKYSPMFSVEEVVKWLHWPARSSQGRHLASKHIRKAMTNAGSKI